MKRLSGLDATFLYSETEDVHMHTIKVAIVDVARSPDVDVFERLEQVLGSRLHLLPPFTMRPVKVPMAANHPVWMKDPEFSLRNHLRRITCPAPGTQRELDDVVARIASIPLDRSKPLWELWYVDGLACGRVAYVAKLHHAMADGMASSALLANVMNPAPHGGDGVADEHPRSLPPRGKVLLDAISEYPQRAAELPRLTRHTIEGAARLIRHNRHRGGRTQGPFQTPRTLFNRKLTGRRTFATVDVALDDVLDIKRALGVTVNDVVLAVAGTATHRYLQSAGERPDRPLLATVPVSVAKPAAARLLGNELSNLFTSLCTDVTDPVERVRAISATAKAAKDAHHALGSDIMRRWAEYTPAGPYRQGFRLYSKLRMADRVRPAANLIVSNVRGPGIPLEVAGARLHRLYSVGPVLEGLGLNVTAWSYCGRMGFSALSCQSAADDLHPLTDLIAEAVDELRARV